MILPVPQCWASRCLNHLPALADSSVSLCDCCANHLPAQPLFSCVNSGVFLRRGAGSPCGSTWRRPCCWWGGQGRAGSIAGGWGGHSSPTPRSSPPGLCHSAPTVRFQPHEAWVTKFSLQRALSQGPGCAPGFGVTGTSRLLCHWPSPSPGTYTRGPFSVAYLSRVGWWWHLRPTASEYLGLA